MNQYIRKEDGLYLHPEVEEPSEIVAEYFDEVFGRQMQAYNQWLSSKIEMSEELKAKTKAGDKLTEGVDFRIGYEAMTISDIWRPTTKEMYESIGKGSKNFRVIAIPIKDNNVIQPSDSNGGGVEQKIARLLELTDEFIFPAYYSHTGKKMWKIENVYTKYNQETLVLCGVDEGISKAIDLAIEAISERREKYYSK